jgi:peptide methionine sulfoxide reductase MsrB
MSGGMESAAHISEAFCDHSHLGHVFDDGTTQAAPA